MKKLSHLTNNLECQEMFQILAKAKKLEAQGREIMHFELGGPSFDTPSNMIDPNIKKGVEKIRDVLKNI